MMRAALIGLVATLAFGAATTSCREESGAEPADFEALDALGYHEHWTSIVPFPINDQASAASNFDREFALYDKLVEFVDTETSDGGDTFVTTYRVTTTDPIDFVVAANASTVFVATTDASNAMTVERWDISTARGSLAPPVSIGSPAPIGAPSPFPSPGPSTPIGGTFVEPSVRTRPPTVRRTVVSTHGPTERLVGLLPDPQNRYLLTLDANGNVAQYDLAAHTTTPLTTAAVFPELGVADAGRILDHSQRGRIMMFHAPNLGTSGTTTVYFADAENDGVFESIGQGTKSDLVSQGIYGLLYWDMLYR